MLQGGWTNCPGTCDDSCVPPLGPQKTPGGDNMTKADCEKACKPDGSGGTMCDAHDQGIPHTSMWGPSWSYQWGATAILPGKFGGAGVAPVAGKITNYPYRWVTVGGAGTSSSNWQDSAERDIVTAGALGCAFDEEGGVTAAAAKPWVKAMRKKHSKWTFVYVPQCGTPIDAYDPSSGGADFVAPMMYYSNGDSYPGMDFTQGSGNTADCLKQIQKAGWPPSRTILTFQSFDAYRVSGHGGGGSGGSGTGLLANGFSSNSTTSAPPPCVGCASGTTEGEVLLKTLGLLLGNHKVTVSYWGTSSAVLQGPYAGVLGWPAQCGGPLNRCWPGMDMQNFKV
jgi:hypothetical protein